MALGTKETGMKKIAKGGAECVSNKHCRVLERS